MPSVKDFSMAVDGTANFEMDNGLNYSVPLSEVMRDGGNGLIIAPNGTLIGLSEVIPEVLANPTATTVVLTGPGTFSGYRCTTAVGNITVYDNTAGSGKVLVPTTALTVGSFPIYGAGHPGRVQVTNGVCIVLSGAAVVYAGVGVL